jgi:hypothetical protein
MAEDELSALLCLFLDNVINFLSAFTMPLYLAFRSRWLDLAYGISGV